MSQIKRALVTGAAGFIGSHLCDALLAQGVEVLGIDDLSGSKGNNEYCKANLETIDIHDLARLSEYVNGFKPDAIFHLAVTKKQVSDRYPRQTIETNIIGTFNLLELSAIHDVKKFIYASTGSVLAPMKEHRDDAHISYPLSIYGISKMAAEAYVNLYHEVHGLNTTILRYFHVYGPRQDDTISGVVGIFCRQALHEEPLTIHGDGSQVRCFTYVDDVVKATMKAANNPAVTYGCTHNIVSNERISIFDLAGKIWRLAQVENRIIFQGQRDLYERKEWNIDNVSACYDLQMCKWTSFDIGLQKTFEWYKEKYN